MGFTVIKSAFRLFIALDKLGVRDSRRDSAARQEICETLLKEVAHFIKVVFLVELDEDSVLLSLLSLQEPEIHLPSLGQRDPPPPKMIRIVNLLRGIDLLPDLAASRIKLGIGNLETPVYGRAPKKKKLAVVERPPADITFAVLFFRVERPVLRLGRHGRKERLDREQRARHPESIPQSLALDIELQPGDFLIVTNPDHWTAGAHHACDLRSESETET